MVRCDERRPHLLGLRENLADVRINRGPADFSFHAISGLHTQPRTPRRTDDRTIRFSKGTLWHAGKGTSAGIRFRNPAEPPPVIIDLPGEAWLPRDYCADFRAKIDVYRRLSRATAERQVADLAAELSDRFGPLPDEARRLLDFAKLRCRAIDLGIDSITRHPGMIMIGHHDRQRIDALRQAAAKKGRVVRVVDQKTAVVPLHADTLADPNKLLASIRSLVDLA